MDNVLDYKGVEISDIPVINRPSYFLVNNYGRESYMTILEPIGEFKRTPERVMLASSYKSVAQLVAAFKEKAPVGNTESGYNRKDVVEIFFMGFTWQWRPNHKSFYGGIRTGYELLPLIARWIVLTGAQDHIDNKSVDYLPIKYCGGTGKGFGGAEVDEDLVTVVSDNNKSIADFEKAVASAKVNPLIHSIAGTVARAAQLNIVPKEAFMLYDNMIDRLWKGDSIKINADFSCKYVLQYEDDGKSTFIGAFYGRGELPSWAKEVDDMDTNGYKVTLVSIDANNINDAEKMMESLLK